jgi:hypothetical protein
MFVLEQNVLQHLQVSSDKTRQKHFSQVQYHNYKQMNKNNRSGLNKTKLVTGIDIIGPV